MAEVKVLSDIIVEAPQEPAKLSNEAKELQSRPSIAVLKAKLSGPQTPLDFLAEALPDDVLTALARMRSLFVTARGSSFAHTSYSGSPRAVGNALNASYVFSSDLQIEGKRLRLSCELADTHSEASLWRYTIQIAIDEIHEMREEIVRNIATNIDQNIALNELQSARLRTPESLDVWQSFHLGTSRFETLGAPDFDGATAHFEKAVAAEPHFARAHAGLSMSNLSRFFWKWNSGMGIHAKNGQAAAIRAYELDPLDPVCALVASRRHFFIGQHEAAEVLLRQSVSLSPSNYWAQADLARLCVQKGETDAATKHLDLADALHPAWLNPVYKLETRSLIAIIDGQLDKAVEIVKQLEALNLPRVYSTMAALTAYHLAGMDQDAARIAEVIRRKFNGISGYRVVAKNSSIAKELAAAIESAYAAHGLD